MAQFIDKYALVKEINKRIMDAPINHIGNQRVWAYNVVKDIISNLKAIEFNENPLYIVTRSEEHSDYVEKAFFSLKKAEEYCKQFEDNEDEYDRDIIEIEVDFPTIGGKEGDEYYEKRYKEALGIAKLWNKNTAVPKEFKDILKKMFSELQESEDEKVRKEILDRFCKPEIWN